MVTRILAKFEVLPDPDKPVPSLESGSGLTREPKERYKAIFKPRV